MTKPSCDTQEYLPPTSEYSTYIANCVLNIFLSYTAIMLNFVTIHAIRKTLSFPKPLKTLLRSLAVSDVGVGLLVQPLYISLMVRWLRENIPSCIAYNGLFIIIRLFCQASYFNVVAISVDKFLAIYLHLRYQELVTHKRVAAGVISIWLFSGILSLMTFPLETEIASSFLSTIGLACLLVTSVVYWRIYLVLRRHKNQMRSPQTPEVRKATHNEEMANFASLRKSAVSVFYVYLVFLVCYLPRFILLAVRAIDGPSLALKRFFTLLL